MHCQFSFNRQHDMCFVFAAVSRFADSLVSIMAHVVSELCVVGWLLSLTLVWKKNDAESAERSTTLSA